MLRLLINLDRSTDRLSEVTKRLNDLKIPFERVSAVDGCDLSQSTIESLTYPINHFETKVRFTRALTPGEIGCFLSHIKCWKKLASSTEKWALILEDDIQISTFARKYLIDDNWLPSDIKICQLSNLVPQQNGKIAEQPRKIDNFLSIVRPSAPIFLGTQAYFISKEFATRAIELSLKLPAPVDNFLFSPWFSLYNEYPLWKTSPILVIPKEETESEIGQRSKKYTKKAPFWIRHGPKRFFLDIKIKHMQTKGYDHKFIFK